MNFYCMIFQIRSSHSYLDEEKRARAASKRAAFAHEESARYARRDALLVNTKPLLNLKHEGHVCA